ncbi:MAG: recombination protein RecR [Ruminococcaceae bacterium]|jgi:recombination protein RecR|nr:recombination protein RecR [Oscillospiraceae bacterium]
MRHYAAPLEKLIEQFEKLPGVGHKSATRLAFHVLAMSKEDASAFAQAIIEAKTVIKTCSVCQNLTEGDKCPICSDPTRDASTICVVALPQDLIAIERTREYNGLYHVLHGVISPLNNIGPEDIRIRELLQRAASDEVKEIILATNPDTEGETTAMYIARLLRPFGIKITRLAYGMPVGGHVEFSDQKTLSMALEGRRELQ